MAMQGQVAAWRRFLCVSAGHSDAVRCHLILTERLVSTCITIPMLLHALLGMWKLQYLLAADNAGVVAGILVGSSGQTSPNKETMQGSGCSTPWP